MTVASPAIASCRKHSEATTTSAKAALAATAKTLDPSRAMVEVLGQFAISTKVFHPQFASVIFTLKTFARKR
jgi:hypothetical protein